MNEQLVFMAIALMGLTGGTAASLSTRASEFRRVQTQEVLASVSGSASTSTEATLEEWAGRFRAARAPEVNLNRMTRLGVALAATLLLAYLASNAGADAAMPYLNLAAIALGSLYFIYWTLVLFWATSAKRSRKS